MSAARKPREAGPLEQLEGLERELAAGKPLARAYLVRGDEGYFRERAVRAVCESAARAGLEIARHDAGDPDFKAGELCDDLSSASMFAPARCVVLRRAAKIVKGEEGDSSSGGAVQAALAFLRREGEAGVLVLDAQALRADSVLAKAVREAGGPALTLRKLYDTPPPWDPDPRRTELVQWILARARARKLDLRPDDAAFVAAATGNELAALEAQLERIENRGAAGVRESVPWTSGGSPFEVAEELATGDLPRSLSKLEALFRGGFQGREGRETNESALVAILLSVLHGKVSATLAALEDPPELPANPRSREELQRRLSARSSEEWLRFAHEFWALEARARVGGGLDVHEFCRFALRTRARRAERAPAAAQRRSR
ncbi:MAG: hypothetical protein IPJ19_12430 [Planctomycetes bacterium]|nr:hypothetical protein [Planctomycetota bacterium]